MSFVLQVAAWQGHPDVVAYLIGIGADVNVPKNNGATPLFIAAEQGYVEVRFCEKSSTTTKS